MYLSVGWPSIRPLAGIARFGVVGRIVTSAVDPSWTGRTDRGKATGRFAWAKPIGMRRTNLTGERTVPSSRSPFLARAVADSMREIGYCAADARNSPGAIYAMEAADAAGAPGAGM